MLETKELTPVFGRHEGVYPKINHFKKLIDCVEKNPKIFSQDDASLILGIGKSQVKALKFWGLAFKLIQEDSKEVFVSDLGRNIFSENGSDPYLENMITVQLLTNILLTEPCMVPSWYFFFNEFKQVEFSKEDLANSIEIWAKKVFPNVEISQKNIKKDAELIIKMYSENIPENPFFKLGAIKDMGDYYIIDRGEIWLQA